MTLLFATYINNTLSTFTILNVLFPIFTREFINQESAKQEGQEASTLARQLCRVCDTRSQGAEVGRQDNREDFCGRGKRRKENRYRKGDGALVSIS